MFLCNLVNLKGGCVVVKVSQECNFIGFCWEIAN